MNFFKLIKSVMPIGIYGRSYLILFFPIIILLIFVFGVFVQRHFDKVTRQMVSSFLPHLQFVVTRINETSDANLAITRVRPYLAPLNVDLEFIDSELTPKNDKRLFYDFSGNAIIHEIRENFSGIISIVLTGEDAKIAEINFITAHGNASIQVSRNILSPSNPHQFLVLIIFVGLLSSLISFLFLRNQLRPIRRLALAAEAFGRGENLNLPISGARELRSAISAFLEMRKRIEQHLQQMSEMLSSISHDLKTPLTRIRLEIEMLNDQNIKDEIVQDIDAMNHMITELLDFTKGEEAEAFQDINPLNLADTIVKNAKRTGQHIIFKPSTEITIPLLIRCKPFSLHRSIENLIVNASNHSNLTHFRISYENGFLIFTIEDNGPGIDKKNLSRVISPFFRLDTARNLDSGKGTGLGLTIANKVAVEHGGKLVLGKSNDLGGLRAELSIPA